MSIHALDPATNGPACDLPLPGRASARSVPFEERAKVTCGDCLKTLAFARAAVQGKLTTMPVEEELPEPPMRPIIKFPGAP